MKHLYTIPFILLCSCTPLNPTVNLDYSSTVASNNPVVEGVEIWSFNSLPNTTLSVITETLSNGDSSCSLIMESYKSNILLIREFVDGSGYSSGEIEFTIVGSNRWTAMGRWIGITLYNNSLPLDISGFKLIEATDIVWRYRGVISNTDDFNLIKSWLHKMNGDITYRIWWRDINQPVLTGLKGMSLSPSNTIKIGFGNPSSLDYDISRHTISSVGLEYGLSEFNACINK